MIPYQMVRFPIGGALDTKTDTASLQAPGLAKAENCWMDRSGALSKRYGYVSLGVTTDIIGATVPAFVGMASINDTFIGFSTDYSYMYLPSAARYTPVGPGVSAVITSSDLSAMSSVDARMMDHADVGNYSLYAIWETGNQIRWVIRDNTADSIVASEDFSSASYPRVVARGSLIYLFYCSTAATQLRVRIFDFTSTATMISSMSAASVLVASDMDTAQPVDAVSNSTYGIFIAYNTTTANTAAYGFVSTAGALSATGTIATTAAPSCIACAVSPGLAVHGVVYARNTQPNDIYAVLLSYNGAAWSVVSTSGAIDSAMDGGTSATACSFGTSNTTLTIWYVDEPAGLSLHQGSYTTAGVATGRAFTVYRARLAAKPFRYNGVWYAAVLVVGSAEELQSCIYVVSIDGVALTGAPVSGTVVATLSENATVFASARGNYFGQVTAAQRVDVIQRLTPGNVATSLAALRRTTATVATIDFTSLVAHKTVQVGGVLYMGGGMLLQYDGGPNGFIESGFLRLVDPAEIVATPGAAGSLTASSQYNYHVIPERLNAHGVREQGTNFGPKIVTLGVGEDQVTLDIATIAAGVAPDLIVFGIYRTESNGTVYYRVGSVANNSTAETVQFVDTLADSDIVTNESFPYADGLLLENTPPPAGHIIGLANGRLFVASPTVRGLIYASKTFGPGEPVEFYDGLTIQLPDDGSDITALSQLSGALVVFTENSVYSVSGEGPSNTGEGQFNTPLRHSVDCGCLSQLSVVEGPMGVLFRGTKGMMLLDQSFQLQYIGASLEDPDSDPIGDDVYGVLMPSRQQVRFSDGERAFVYDYYHRQWFTWTQPWRGQSALLSGDQYIASQTGEVLRETSGTYADDGTPYTMTVRTAPFRDPAGINGQIRVRRVGVSGRADASFTLTVVTSHDFNATTVQTLTSSIASGADFFEDWRTNTKILRGLQLTVSDGGGANAGMRLREVAVEIGQRVAGKSLGR